MSLMHAQFIGVFYVKLQRIWDHSFLDNAYLPFLCLLAQAVIFTMR